MQVYLVKPRCFNSIDALFPNLALAILSAELESVSNSIKVFDLNFMSQQDFLLNVVKNKPNFICFTTFLDDFNNTIKLCQECKKISQNLKIIIGGPQISLLGDKIKKFSNFIDYAIQGEGEIILPLILKGIGFKNESIIKNYVIKRYNSLILISPKKFINNLDNLDLPKWDYLNLDYYFPVLLIQTSRGCPYNCPFCFHSKLNGKKLRKKSLIRVIQEIKLCINNYKIRHFRFIDSIFSSPINYFNNICKKIINENLNIKWSCYSRIENLSKKSINLAKEAGCVAMYIGFESGDPILLKKMRKYTNIQKTKDLVSYIKRKQIYIHGSFIIGFPGENEYSINNTIKLMENLKLNSVSIYPLYVIPHTELHLNADKWGITFLKEDWILNYGKYYLDDTIYYFKHHSMAQSEIYNTLRQIKDRLKNRHYYIGLKDYQIIAWISLGGSLKNLKKLWRQPELYLDMNELKFFKSFKGGNQLKIEDMKKFKITIESITKRNFN